MTATETPIGSKNGPRLSLRDEQKLMTHERLLSGALEVFQAKGYSLATVDDITTQAGASRATFYLHFKSKFEVIEALYARYSGEVQELFRELDGLILGDSREPVREWTSRTLAWYANNSVYALALEQAVLIEGSVAAAMRRPYLDFMPNLAAAWPAERHQEVNMRVWLLVKTMTAFFIGQTVYGVFANVSHDGAVDAITDLYVAGLRPNRR